MFPQSYSKYAFNNNLCLADICRKEFHSVFFWFVFDFWKSVDVEQVRVQEGEYNILLTLCIIQPLKCFVTICSVLQPFKDDLSTNKVINLKLVVLQENGWDFYEVSLKFHLSFCTFFFPSLVGLNNCTPTVGRQARAEVCRS